MSRVRSFSQRRTGLLPLLLLTLLWPAMALTQDDAPTTDAVKLLLTEVSAWSDYSNPHQYQYVEITNPNDVDVDLTDYYLTDANVSGPSPAAQVFYWRIAQTPEPTTLSAWRQRIGGGTNYNFHARFPDGFVLAAGQTIVISIAPAEDFHDKFGRNPHLQLYGTGDVPSMRAVFGEPGDDSIVGSGASNPPHLDVSSESVVLYHWDGTSDHVTDIDVFLWGDNINRRFSKNGVTVGEHTYAPETLRADQQPFLGALTAGQSFHRTDMDETGQSVDDGNGVDDRDEVGEPFPVTWEILAFNPGMPHGAQPPQVVSTSVASAVAGEPVRVRATVQPGDQGVASVTMFYTVGAGTEQNAAAASISGDLWEAALGTHAAGTQIAWRVVVAAESGPGAEWPAGGGTSTLIVLAAGVLCYSWEDDNTILGGTLLGQMLIARTTDRAFHGDHSLEIVKTGGSGTPQAWVAHVTDLEVGDEVTVTVQTLDFSTGASPSVRLWGHWTNPGGPIGNVAYQAGGSDDYSGAADWLELSYTWTVGADQAGFGLAIQIRTYNATTPPEPLEMNWIDYLCVQAPVYATVEFPGEPIGTGPGDALRIVSASMTGAMVGTDLVVRARVFPGEEPIETVTVYYTVDGGAVRTRAATHVGNNWYEANLGQYPAGTVILWRLEAAAGDEVATFPAEPGTWAGPVEVIFDVALVVPPVTFVPDIEVFTFDFFTRAGYETRVRLFDIQGRLVLTLHDSRFDGQVTERTVTWDGRDETFERVRAGMYVIHLQAVDPATGETIIQTAPVVVATRLK